MSKFEGTTVVSPRPTALALGLDLLPPHQQVGLSRTLVGGVRALPRKRRSELPKRLVVGAANRRRRERSPLEGEHHLLGLQELHVLPLQELSLLGVDFLAILGRGLFLMLQQVLVVFELQFEAQVGTYVGSAGADVLDGGGEGNAVLLHVVCDDQGGRLTKVTVTREMPAPQWTRTEPRFRSTSQHNYFPRWSGRTDQSSLRCSRF